MKKFIMNLIFFTFIIVSVVFVGIYISKILIRNSNLMNIDQTKTTLVIGDSRTENALDDRILTNICNLSMEADSYFFTYIKLREILKLKNNFNTIILGYSYHNLTKDMDSWSSDHIFLVDKIARYDIFMTFDDYITISKSNVISIFKSYPVALFNNLKLLTKIFRDNISISDSNIGSFTPISNELLEKDIKKLRDGAYKEIRQSKIQKKYLLKIRELCRLNNKKLILLNTPTHEEFLKNQPDLEQSYIEFFENNLSNLLFLNYGNYELPNSAFSDTRHLNSYGAKLFSNMLKEKKQAIFK